MAPPVHIFKDFDPVSLEMRVYCGATGVVLATNHWGMATCPACKKAKVK